MEDNIFKRLRLEHTEEVVMRGEGKKIEVKKPLSGTKLASEMNISQPTLDNAENGFTPSLSTLTAYHKYFGVPYSTLLGETDTMNIENLHINKELGLSDKSISTLKGLSPIALSMLNALLGQSLNTELFLYNLAENIYSMTEQLKQNDNNKSEKSYLIMRQHAENLFMDYMKTVTFSDLKSILYQLEKQHEMTDYASDLTD